MFKLIKIGKYYVNPNYIVGVYATSKQNQCVIDTVNNVGEDSSCYYVEGSVDEIAGQILAQTGGH
jgi:hypothetical protein